MQVITVTLFATRDANDAVIRAAYLAKARALLHNQLHIEVDRTQRTDEEPWILPYDGSIDDGKDGGKLRAMCQTALPVGRGIPVIFGKFLQASIFAVTVLPSGRQNNGIFWLPYILINTRLRSKHDAVLLHELIHAAYGDFPPLTPGGDHDVDPQSVFFDSDQDSSQEGRMQVRLPAKHVDPLRRAYFTHFAA